MDYQIDEEPMKKSHAIIAFVIIITMAILLAIADIRDNDLNQQRPIQVNESGYSPPTDSGKSIYMGSGYVIEKVYRNGREYDVYVGKGGESIFVIEVK